MWFFNYSLVCDAGNSSEEILLLLQVKTCRCTSCVIISCYLICCTLPRSGARVGIELYLVSTSVVLSPSPGFY